MTKRSANSQSPFEFALEFETKGVNLYLKLARAAVNPLGKKLFYSLAMEEVQHAAKIEEISARLKGRADYDYLLARKLPSLQSRMKEFFGRLPKGQLRAGAEDLSGYELAMKMEREGYRTYEDFRDRAQSPTEKEFLAALLAEEKEHLEALANVYSFLTRTGDWLQEDESRTWNWMNM